MTNYHSLVLTAPKIDLAAANITSIGTFIKELMIADALTVDYFNCELDNQCDYIDEDMAQQIESTTHITFHFPHNTPIDYKSYDKEGVFNFIYDKLTEGTPPASITIDEKDIEIHLH